MKSWYRALWTSAVISGAVLVGCVSELANPAGGDAGKDSAAKTLVEGGSNGPSNLGTNCSGCADFTGDGVVNDADLGILLAQFNGPQITPCVDLNNDGVVNDSDLGLLLNQFGQPCANGNTNANVNGGNTNANVNGGNTNANVNGGNTNANVNGGNTNSNVNGGNTNANVNGGNTNANVNGGNTNANVNGGNTNANVNGGLGICPDGSTRVSTNLSGPGDGDARYRTDNGSCEHFRARVDDAQPFTTYAVAINGVVVGSITTDDDGKGELEYNTGQFPATFPDTVLPGSVITVGPFFGVFQADCSGIGCS